MPTGRPGRYCKACNELETADNPLSSRRLHEACAIERIEKARREIAQSAGPAWEKWVAGQIANLAKRAGIQVVQPVQRSRKRKRAA